MTLPAFTTLGAGPVVLMLHGVSGGHLCFAPQVETLASSGYRAVAWDMPGYGRSAPVEPYHFKGLAERCIALIDSLGGQVTLVGHSMGGMVAQEVVARKPAAVSQLMLCGTSPAFGRAADGSVALEWQQKFIAERTASLDAGGSMAELAEVLIPRMIGPGALPEGVQLALHTMRGVNPATYRRALEAMLAFDRRANLAHIHVPTLLLAGEHDRVAPPAVMKKMAQAIPGSTYLELPGIGHLQNLEAPEAFDAALLNFLALPRALH